MNNTVAYCICQDRVGELFPPSRDVELRTQDRGRSLVSGLHDVKDLMKSSSRIREMRPTAAAKAVLSDLFFWSPETISDRLRIYSFLSACDLFGSVSDFVTCIRAIISEEKRYTDTCVISFIDMYDKTIKNTKPYNISAPTAEEIDMLAAAFSAMVKGSGVRIRTCAEGVDLYKYGIEPNSCIDQARIERIIGCPIKAKPDKQRDNCRCIECADIGLYNTCLHGSPRPEPSRRRSAI